MYGTVGRTIREQYDGRRRVEEGHASLMVKADFFYAEDGLVDSTDLGWPQSAFDMLTGLFDQVGMHKNVCKAVEMVCTPFRESGARSDKDYIRQMTREEWSFKER